MGFRLILLCACVAFTAWARQPWDRSELSWTDADAKRILTDSPWAKTVVPRGRSTAGGWPAAMTLRWESARPVREALRVLGISTANHEQQDFYAIGLVGPANFHVQDAGHSDWEASIKAPGNWSLKALSLRTLNQEGSAITLFLFPKNGPVRQPNIWALPFGVTFPVWKVDFAARADGMEIRQSFAIDKMWYLGQIEL
jgi:hypothetical protein